MKTIKLLLSNSWLQHLLFWMVSLYAIGSYFSISNFLKFIDFIYAGFFHIPLLILVYINLRYHVPKFLQQERYLVYALLSIFNIACAFFLHQLIFDVMIPILPTDFYMVSFTDSTVLISIFIIYLGLTTLLKLSKSWYQLQQTEKEKLFLELNSLKMQINPHFLFNSLNSLYSLARKKSDNAPEAILKLSDLMRYMIYEVTDDKVPLTKEIEACQNYLDLQRLRLEAQTKISFSAEVSNNEQLIAPLLFFPLIENSFKHGLKGDDGDNYVSIELVNRPHELTFSISNNIGKVDDSEEGKYGGIGLENVKKRLNLIYGENASIYIRESENQFEVKIKISWT